MSAVQELERGAAQQNNVRLVVIDSVAALVKKEDRITARQQDLGGPAICLV